MASTDYESRLYSILEDSLSFQDYEAAFCGLLLHPPDEEQNRKTSFLESFKELWNAVSEDKHHDGILQSIVAFANLQKTQARIDYIYELLQLLVETGFLSARRVCETILSSTKLTFTEEKVWHRSCDFIYHFVRHMDYKSVRSIFALLLIKIKEVPAVISASEQCLLEDVKRVIFLIIDRNSCLLPSYFVVNEIYKLYPVGNFHPHWAFGNAFTEFVSSFRPLAQMVTVTGRPSLLPIVGHSSPSAITWKLEPTSLKFSMKGPLPYNKDLLEPQRELVRYVIAQPYSRDLVCSMLGLNKQQKQRCPALEELLADLIVIAMERSEKENGTDKSNQLLWQHLSSQLIFFVLFQFASFPHMVSLLHQKLSERNLFEGRNQLMWVLLQFISGSIQKSPLSDFLPVIDLYDALYRDDEPLPVPDVTKPEATAGFAVACIWVHLSKKGQLQNTNIGSTPRSLQNQLSFLRECLESKPIDLQDYRIALLCNAYSTNPDNFSHPMGILVETCYGNGKTTVNLPGLVPASSPTVPCPMEMLDSLTVHAKMSLIHSIVTRVIKLANSQSTMALAPALVETYSRLLVYMEIELLGIKGFISQLLPTVLKSQAWGILHTLLEMFSYRLHHIQPHYRVTLLSHLHSLATVPMTDKNQLHLCFQSTALRLITGFGSAEVQPQLSSSRLLQDPKQILSKDWEELNRVLILTIARAIKVTGSETLPLNWCEGVLKNAITITPHSWASHTIASFPKALQHFYSQHPCKSESKDDLKRRVEEEYKAMKGMSIETDILNHFAGTNAPDVFLCVIWKVLLENANIPTVCYRVLMELGPRALSTQIRVFADFLVYEFSSSGAGKHVHLCFQYLHDMVWKYNIFTLDRLVLSMALRHHEGNEAQVCFFIIQLLLLKNPDFRNRVQAFVRDNSPDHWRQVDWHQKHVAYHTNFPEKFYFEGLLEANSIQMPSPTYLPVYFGNICLRFLPVFDIVIHRFLELPPVSKSLETLLDQLGSLYKFHDQPITYLYNILHYYEERLRDRPSVKKKLVASIIGAQQDCHPAGWSLSQGFLDYISRKEDERWIPDHSYYCSLVGRLVDTIAGKSPSPFPACDWRFNEFPNPSAHALHVTCVELMASPITGIQGGQALFDVLYLSSTKGQDFSIRKDIMTWINAIAITFTSLPDSSWSLINTKVCTVLQNDLATFNFNTMSSLPSFFDCVGNQALSCESHADYVLALFHAFWHHASIGQFTLLPQMLRDRFKPFVINEAQLLYILCLFGPFLQRFQTERTRCLLEIATEFYHIIDQVCRSTSHFFYVDVICDFLYHLKYMFVGDGIREIVEKTIVNFHEGLQHRLRFMTTAAKREEMPHTA